MKKRRQSRESEPSPTKSNKKDAKQSYAANIKVVGVGGGGCNAVSRMRESGLLRGVDFVAINTDAQDLDFCSARKKIYIGKNLTRGLGTGMNPELGRQAAEENRSEIIEALKGADLIFVAAGLGGGTGSGASPVVAEAAREIGALTVAIVTKPFSFEGAQRARIAGEALTKLKEKVDTFIVVPNDRVFSVIAKDTPILKAFDVIDDVLRSAVSGISEIVALHGLVNVDFADVKTVMQNTGSAVVAVGIASGQDRAAASVNAAITSPLLEASIDGARSVLFGVSGRDIKMNEIHDIAKVIGASIDPSARIIFGAYHDRKVRQGALKVTLIATNFNGVGASKSETQTTSLFAAAESQPTKPSISSSLAPVKDGKDQKEKDIVKPALPGSFSPDKKKPTDAWDIPTFLRRNRRDE